MLIVVPRISWLTGWVWRLVKIIFLFVMGIEGVGSCEVCLSIAYVGIVQAPSDNFPLIGICSTSILAGTSSCGPAPGVDSCNLALSFYLCCLVLI